MEKCAPVARLILAELGWVDEETIAGGQQQPGSGRPGRQTKAGQIIHDEGGVGILGPEILTKLVSEIGRGVPLGEHRRRRMAVNRAVIRG